MNSLRNGFLDVYDDQGRFIISLDMYLSVYEKVKLFLFRYHLLPWTTITVIGDFTLPRNAVVTKAVSVIWNNKITYTKVHEFSPINLCKDDVLTFNKKWYLNHDWT